MSSKLDILCSEINKKQKEKIAAKGIDRIKTSKIPLSSPKMNYMLYGGLPRGRLIEFSGEEGGGKTTTALDVVHQAQILFAEEWQTEIDELSEIKSPNKTQQARLQYLMDRGVRKVFYADCENTLDEDWAVLLGVDVSELYVLKPQSQSAEVIFQIILDAMETDEVGLVIIDSLGFMLSDAAFEEDMSKKTYGGIAQSLTLFSKKAQMACTRRDITLIGINQLREDLNSPFNKYNTTGGKGWKHNCSVRLFFQKGVPIDLNNNELKLSNTKPDGNIVMASVLKTKVFKPDRKLSSYTLKYGSGIDQVADTIDMALEYGFVIQQGAWYNIVDIETGELMLDEEEKVIKIQGRPNLIDFMWKNQTIFDEIYENVSNKINE